MNHTHHCPTCGNVYGASEADHVLRLAYDQLQSLGRPGLHRGTPVDRADVLAVIQNLRTTHAPKDQP